RGNFVFAEASRIDHAKPGSIGEPQAPVGRQGYLRERNGGCLHAIECVKDSGRGQLNVRALTPVLTVRLRKSDQPALRIQPESVQLIRYESVDLITRQSVV